MNLYNKLMNLQNKVNEFITYLFTKYFVNKINEFLYYYNSLRNPE